MKKVIYSLIKNKKITLFFVFAIIAAGILSFIQNPKQESPDFSIPYAMITTTFPGASQSDVDKYVTEPIEKQLKSIEGYEETSSYSMNSLSLVILELKFSADRDEAFSELKEKLNTLQSSLPEGCGTINVNTNITDTAGVLMCLSSDNLTNYEVVGEAESIVKGLDEIDGFSRFEIIGRAEKEVTVTVKEEAMKAAGLTYSDIVSLIQAGSMDIPIGKVKEGTASLSVDYNGGYSSLDDIKNLEVGFSPEQNKVIRLKDIADISYETAQSNTQYKYNGNQAVIIAGYFEEGINTLPMKDEIDDKLDELENDFPEGLNSQLIMSQPEEIDDSLISFLNNLAIAVALVIVVVLLGMGVRNAIVVSVSLPLSVLMSFGAMSLLGIKIHQISITALIVSLGMLVDNSIVVSDSIQGYLDIGIKHKKACYMGVKNVAVPVLTSTITTVAAFLPFLFLNSIAGDYIKSLPQIVSISLSASYITAMLIIPVMAYIFFKPHKKAKKKTTLKAFKKLLVAGMGARALVLIIVLLLAGGSVYLALNLDTIFFPASDKNILYIDVKNNIADNTEETSKIVDAISEMISKEDGITEYSSAAGAGLPRFNQIMYIYTKTPDIGQIMMRIDLNEAGFDTNEEFKDYLQEKINDMDLDAKITVKELMYAFPMDEDLKVRITGDDIDKLKEYEDKVYEILNNEDGIINLNRGNSIYKDEYTMEVSGDKALPYGLMPVSVQNEMSIALMGRTASHVSLEGYDSNIVVIGSYETKSDIQKVPLKTVQGSYVQASDVVDINKTSTLSTLPRHSKEYSLTITADYDLDYDKNDTLSDIKDKIDGLELDGARVEYDGEDVLIRENFGQISILGAVALAIVFMILMVQFKSFTMPLVIFMTIPLSAIGSIAGLYITGQPISFTAMLGIVSLLGIVVNNAIILIDYIKKEQAVGTDIKKACINASLKRLRPILLSTTTTIIGLIPLAVSQSQLFKPMAIALMSGLLVSTLLTLVVLPVFVSLAKRKA